MNISLRVALGLAGLTACAVSPTWLAAQTPKEAQAREVDILRRTIAEQQSHPGEVIRTPQTFAYSTNSVYAARRADLERQYLEGKLTAKQYQKALEQLRQEERKHPAAAAAAAPAPVAAAKQTTAPPAPAPAAVSTPAPAPAPAAARAGAPKGTVAPAAVVPPATPPGAEATTPQQKTVSDVESKLDEMLRLKAAREKAALTNTVATTNAVPGAPQTRRQRLDAILRQLVNGQISEADYNTKRAQILAEPD
jgi:hypothetical protein